MAFFLASLFGVCTFTSISLGAKGVLVAMASLLLIFAITANVRELRVAGASIGFSGFRTLPIAGLNFSALLTLLVMVQSFGAVISGALGG